MKVTIFTTKQNRRNLQIEIGGHLVEFDGNLSATVEENVATELMELDSSIGVVGESPVEEIKEEVKEEVVVSSEPATEIVEESIVEENEDAVIDFDALTLAELKAVAKESNLPSKEWSTLKKVALIEYLQSKL